MEVLKDFDWSKSGKTRRSKYPWDKWTDGQTYQVVRGEDYECKTISLIAALRWKANSLGMKLHTATDEDDKAVIFQFSGKDGKFA